LLSKASEYSNFISKDLEDLQHAMAENARKRMEKTEKRKKKGEQAPPKKKRKGDAGEKLKTALVKDAQVRAGSKPIFVQPENLAEGCFLMDYQLEGVRWLASLFENGVSGILADEVRRRPPSSFWQDFYGGSSFANLYVPLHRWVWEKRFKLLRWLLTCSLWVCRGHFLLLHR
jgi:hypothetical protein